MQTRDVHMLRINDLFDLVDTHVADEEVRQWMHRVTRWLLSARATLGIENRVTQLLELQSRPLQAVLEAAGGCGAITPEELSDYLSRVEELLFTDHQAAAEEEEEGGEETESTSLVASHVTSSSCTCGTSGTSGSTEGTSSSSCDVDDNFSTSTAGAAADLITHFHEDLGRLWGDMRRATRKSNVALLLALLALGASMTVSMRVLTATPRDAQIDTCLD